MIGTLFVIGLLTGYQSASASDTGGELPVDATIAAIERGDAAQLSSIYDGIYFTVTSGKGAVTEETGAEKVVATLSDCNFVSAERQPFRTALLAYECEGRQPVGLCGLEDMRLNVVVSRAGRARLMMSEEATNDSKCAPPPLAIPGPKNDG